MKDTKIHTASRGQDFREIVNLQKLNLTQYLSEDEAQKQGFVTLEHDALLLEKMNQPYPHIIATHEGEIIGYILVMLREYKEYFPVLTPIIDTINFLTYNGQSIKKSKYFIMGQVCIAKEARGQNIFSQLYQVLEEQMQNDFQYMITVISNLNRRSIRAHEKIGFKTIHIDTSKGRDWIIVLKQL